VRPAGITTFVCLQSEFSIDVPEREWRAGRALRPYIHDAQRVLRMAHETGYAAIRQRKIDFLHLPIDDGGVTSDAAMDKLAEDCIARVRRGERLYIHCWGGHGRTGTLVAVMLGRIYGISYAAALHCTQTFHDSRRFPQGVRSPSTAMQRAQVRRLLGAPAPAPPRARPSALQAGAASTATAPRVPRPAASALGAATGTAAARGATPRAPAGGVRDAGVDRLSKSIESLRNLSLSAGRATGAAKSAFRTGGGR